MSLQNTAFEVVEAYDLGHTAKRFEGVLVTPNERFNILLPNGFFVGMAGMGQDDFEEPWFEIAAILEGRCAFTEVDLAFFTRCGVNVGNDFRRPFL